MCGLLELMEGALIEARKVLAGVLAGLYRQVVETKAGPVAASTAGETLLAMAAEVQLPLHVVEGAEAQQRQLQAVLGRAERLAARIQATAGRQSLEGELSHGVTHQLACEPCLASCWAGLCRMWLPLP